MTLIKTERKTFNDKFLFRMLEELATQTDGTNLIAILIKQSHFVCLLNL